MPSHQTRRAKPKQKRWSGLNLAKMASLRQEVERQKRFSALRTQKNKKTKTRARVVRKSAAQAMAINNGLRRSTRTRKTATRFDPIEEEKRQRMEREIARGQAEFIAQEKERLQEERNAVNAQLAQLMSGVTGIGKPKSQWQEAKKLGRSGSRSHKSF